MDLMPAVILAGGLATRLRPLTNEIPKALTDVAGRPFLWHQLTLLRRNGILSALLLVGHLGEKIRDRFGDGRELGMRLDYSFDGPVLLGTAGAIRNALPMLPPAFFVLYGDSYLMCDYAAVAAAFEGSGRPGLMTVYRNDGLYDRSNVEYDNGRIVRYDKRNPTAAMRHIDYGLGVFSREVFSALPANQVCDLEAVYQDLLRAGRLASFEVHERFYEIGSPEGLRELTALLKPATQAQSQ
jgi:NDP-sugar pyrophosphorylase family protein